MNLRNSQVFFLTTLRILIGWHFLYEGIVKIMNPGWSSLGYLLDSKGLFANFFISLTYNSTILQTIDFINIWGLTLIGLGLILGAFTRFSTLCGILLLSLYYLSHPASPSLEYMLPQEGSYLIVNKTLIEIFSLLVLFVFPTGKIVGLDRLISKLK
ncbi:MAG: DoxX family membrane protein [Bacteroidales bacterium]|nr:DoxX family membrane protein [Bacteroidales bacterium]